MTFPNAYNGIKKVFTAQIMSLISAGCIVFGSLLALGSGVALSVTGVAGGGFFIIAGAVLSLLALIFNLIGLYTAAKDEPSFNTAFALSVVELIVGIVLGIIQNFNGVFSIISSIVSLVLGIFILKYVFLPFPASRPTRNYRTKTEH